MHGDNLVMPPKIKERMRPCSVPEEYWAEDVLRSVISKRAPCGRYCRKIKDIFDFCASVSGIFILSPILLITAGVIKLGSSGPVLYKQLRVGRRGKLFYIYKFRTMEDGAEYKTGPTWAEEDDKRVTWIGKYLRRYHIDELPQLINVVKGEMSLVGPRPERPEFVYLLNRSVPNYPWRHTIKPGITGWAQIRLTYDLDVRYVKKKIRYDLFYRKKMCLAVDVKIIIQTLFSIAAGLARGI